MRICRKAERASVVGDREMFVKFVTPDSECTASIISEWHKKNVKLRAL
jgi:oligoribonuclease NrnB/cAMP/cGMP phosphodiesterase (DHH superfamily)